MPTPHRSFIGQLYLSADYSTSDANCIESMVEDLEKFLAPTVKKLESRRDTLSKTCARQLRKMYSSTGIASRIHGRISWNGTEEPIRNLVRAELEPTVQKLRNSSAQEVRAIARKLEKLIAG